MSITPVASTALESLTSDSGTDAPASGFDLLLASAASPRPKPETSRADDTRDSHAGTGDDKHADKNDDTTGVLAGLAPAVVPPTPTPAPVPTQVAPVDLTANAPTTETPSAPVVVTPPPADALDPTSGDPTTIDPAPGDPAPVPTDPVAGTPSPVAELTDLITPEPTPGVPGPPPAPPRVGNPNEKNAPGPPAHSNAVFNRSPDDASATPEAAPAPAANAKANANVSSAVANAPVIATDHIRVPTTNTPARTEGASTNALDATAPAPPASAPTASTVAVEVVTTTPAATPPPPAEQLVSVLKPMRETPNGSYTLHLELKPPELGRIELRVEMRDGVMHASIHSDREGSAQLLRDALSDLRDRLDAASVRTGSLTVSDGSVGARDRGGANGQSGPGGRDDVANDSTALPNEAGPDLESADPEHQGTSLLDVRV